MKDYVMIYKNGESVCQLPTPPVYKKKSKWRLLTTTFKILLAFS